MATADYSDLLAYSTNGIDWTEDIMPVDDDWYACAYGSGIFVTLSQGEGTSAYSSNGITWTASGPGGVPEPDVWYGLAAIQPSAIITNQPASQAANAGTNVTFSVGAAGSGLSYQWLFDGTIITNQTNSTFTVADADGADAGNYSVIVSNTWGVTESINATLIVSPPADEALFAAGANASTNAVYSMDGSNWLASPTGMPEALAWQRVAYGADKYVAIAYGSSNTAYSLDGRNWAFSPGCLPTADHWVDLAYGNGKFVTVAYGSSQGAYSTDGTNWLGVSLPTGADWNCVGFGNGTFVAIAAYGTNVIYGDGTSWTNSPGGMPYNDYWQCVAYGNGVFAALVGGNSDAAFSATGTNWIVATNLPYNNWGGITFGEGTFVAVAYDSSQMAYSTNGSYWQSGMMSVNDLWYSTAFADFGTGIFVAPAIGASATAAYSTDGITWYNSPGLPYSNTWYTVGARGNPEITTQPVSQVASVGSKATFAVSATGPQPFTYQWYFDGTILGGATNSSLALSNVCCSNVGVYSVTVSNAFGVMESSNAYLTFPPPVTIGAETKIPLPPDAAWNQYVNFRPVSNEVVTLNPPIFNWCYVPGGASNSAYNGDNTNYNFVLQIENDNAFTNPQLNVTTPCNFYNFLPVITNTNGTIYWRVGYVSVTNNVTNLWITNSFQISGSATNWDRGSFTNAGYLSGRQAHPHMMLTITNRAAISNWLGTNTLRVINADWAACQAAATNFNTNAWYTISPIGSRDLVSYWEGCTATMIDVAFMWQMTRNSYWTNGNPTPTAVLTNLIYALVTNGNFIADDVGLGPNPELMTSFGYVYDWMYDAMDSGQRAVFTNAFRQRAGFDHYGIGWWFKPYGVSTGDTVAYTNIASYGTNFVVQYHSDAKSGNTHAHQNMEVDFPLFLADFGDEVESSNMWYLSMNYILGLAVLGGHDGGVSQGRPYDLSENFGSGAQALYTYNNAMNVAVTFPEISPLVNPTYDQTARFLDMMFPVQFYELNDPWGDGVETLQRNYYPVSCGFWSEFGVAAMACNDGELQAHYTNQTALTGDGRVHVPYNFILPYFFPPPAPSTNNITNALFTNDGWVISLPSTPVTPACYSNGTGLIFCARPRGAMESYANGHSTVNDLDFQIWCDGCNVTDAGDSYSQAYAYVSWSHYTPVINGVGQYQNPDEPTHPFYSRILAYTNMGNFVYCAADGLEAYPVDHRSIEDLIGNIGQGPGTLMTPYSIPFETNTSIFGLTNLTRQILFGRGRYFVIYDRFDAQSNYTYSLPYQIAENTLTNQAGGTFTYTCTNQTGSGTGITVYVAQIVNNMLISVTNEAGTNASGPSLKTDAYNGTNEWADYNNIYTSSYTTYYPRKTAVWISNATPTNHWHFMTVIYPVGAGTNAPTITRMDDDTAEVQAGTNIDVVCFNTNAANVACATIVVDSDSILQP